MKKLLGSSLYVGYTKFRGLSFSLFFDIGENGALPNPALQL